MSDPSEVADLLRDQSRRRSTRADLERRHPDLERVSPRVGVLDEAAVRSELATDPDQALDLLADLARATDPELRTRARRLAVRLLLPPTRAGEAERRGSSRLATVADDGLDLDLDATLERALEHRVVPSAPSRFSRDGSPPSFDGGEGTPRAAAGVRAEDLRWQGWRSPARAHVLLVDASGSVAGAPLTTAVTTAAALAAGLRQGSHGDELAVVAFWSRAVVLRDLRSPAAPATVIDALLSLRGGATTDLALGLRTALRQATAARSPRTDVLVLTDGAWNEGDDPTTVAAAAAGSGARVHTLRIVDSEDARTACGRLAAAGGGRSVPLLRPSVAPAAVRAALR